MRWELGSVSLEKERLHKLFELLLQRCISSPPVVIFSYLYHYRLMNIYLIPLAINQQCLVLAQVFATLGIRSSLEPAPVFIDMPSSKVLSMYASISLVLALPVVWRYLVHSLPNVELAISDQLKKRNTVSTKYLGLLSALHSVLFYNRYFISRRHSLSNRDWKYSNYMHLYGLAAMYANSHNGQNGWLVDTNITISACLGQCLCYDFTTATMFLD